MLDITIQMREDLILIDPYYSQKQQSKQIGITVNTLMVWRDKIGLNKKDKGRPVGKNVLYKGENPIPNEVQEAVERLRKEVKEQKQRQEQKRKEKQERKEKRLQAEK